MIYFKSPTVLVLISTMDFINNYLQQQMTNILPIFSFLKLLFMSAHFASNIALNVYIITSLILIILLFIYTIFMYYDNILNVKKHRIYHYFTVLIVAMCIKKKVLFEKVLLFLHTYNSHLLLVLIDLILVIRYCLHKFIISLQQNILDVIIYIISLKLLYSYLKIKFEKKNINDIIDIIDNLYDKCCYIILYYFFLGLRFMLIIFGVLVLLVVYYHIKVQAPTIITL